MANEKRLIELLKEADRKAYEVAESRQLTHPFEVWEIQADHLIANGVTVTDNNVGGKWISVKERLPEERDSLFTSFYGTAKWQEGMFLKCSDTVLASVEYEDGKRRVKAIITKDGKWDIHNLFRASKVTHWMPLPEPPKGE